MTVNKLQFSEFGIVSFNFITIGPNFFWTTFLLYLSIAVNGGHTEFTLQYLMIS